MATDAFETEIRAPIRSPRSAAIAGIIFSVLMIFSMIQLYRFSTLPRETVTQAWLLSWAGQTRSVLTMMPFAGLSFLWFTGVIRDLIGDREDRFFATIYFGSGIIFIALLFIWAAIVGAIYGTYTANVFTPTDHDIVIFGLVLMNQIISNYALRVAGVYMTAIASLWLRANVVPRWFTILTFILALGFIFFANVFRETRFIFPVWVFMVSMYILIGNYRRRSAPA